MTRNKLNLGNSFNQYKNNFMTGQDIQDQIVNISKAAAFDIVSKQVGELKEENAALKARIKYLENLIDEYTGKMLDNLKTPSDIPENLFEKPNNEPYLVNNDIL